MTAQTLASIEAEAVRLLRYLWTEADVERDTKNGAKVCDLFSVSDPLAQDIWRVIDEEQPPAGRCSGIVCIEGNCKRHSFEGTLYCGEHGGLPEYVTDPGYNFTEGSESP